MKEPTLCHTYNTSKLELFLSHMYLPTSNEYTNITNTNPGISDIICCLSSTFSASSTQVNTKYKTETVSQAFKLPNKTNHDLVHIHIMNLNRQRQAASATTTNALLVLMNHVCVIIMIIMIVRRNKYFCKKKMYLMILL